MSIIELLKQVCVNPEETENRRERAKEMLAWIAREIERVQPNLSDKSEAPGLVEWKVESLWPNFVIDPDTDKLTTPVAKPITKPAPALTRPHVEPETDRTLAEEFE